MSAQIQDEDGFVEPRSRQRTHEVVGFVNFPVHLPNSGEGGMFVRLVVIDREDFNDRWPPCCGGYISFHMDESYVGDDSDQVEPELSDIPKDCTAEYLYPFPDLTNPELKGPDEHLKYMSISYLAVINMGATGWSHDWAETGKPWLCTYNDLTADGKALYDQIQKLYPGLELRLQTWLDT